jgi:hypothetical protein
MTDNYFRSYIFWDITPCSPLTVNQNFGVKHFLHLQCRRIRRTGNQHEVRSKLCSFSSEALVDFPRIARRSTPQDRTLHNHRCERLRPYLVISLVINFKIIAIKGRHWAHVLKQTISAHNSVPCVIHFIMKIVLSMLRSSAFSLHFRVLNAFPISCHVSFTSASPHQLSCNHCNIISLVSNKNGFGEGGDRNVKMTGH